MSETENLLGTCRNSNFPHAQRKECREFVLMPSASKLTTGSLPEILDEGMTPEPDRLLTEEEHRHNESLPMPNAAAPVGEREGEFEYVLRPNPAIRAVKWTGDNLDEVRKVYPGIGEDYMMDKGCRVGDYVISPYPGRVYFSIPQSFEQNYIHAALASKPSPAPGGIPERPKHIVISGSLTEPLAVFGYRTAKSHFGVLEALLSAKDAETALIRANALQEIESMGKLRNEWRTRAEAAEAELTSLRASSARIEEETLRRALAAVRDIRDERHLMHLVEPDMSENWVRANAVCEAEQAVVALLPTSPEKEQTGEEG